MTDYSTLTEEDLIERLKRCYQSITIYKSVLKDEEERRCRLQAAYLEKKLEAYRK